MMANKRLMIVGAGAHARVLVDLAQQLPGWDLAGLLDDDFAKADRDVFGVPVLGRTNHLVEIAAAKLAGFAAIAFGDNALRRRFFEFAREAGLELATLVHPSAIISPHARLGAGVVVLAGVIVNAGAVIGGQTYVLNTGLPCRSRLPARQPLPHLPERDADRRSARWLRRNRWSKCGREPQSGDRPRRLCWIRCRCHPQCGRRRSRRWKSGPGP